MSLEELAARGQRHVRVLTAGEAFEEIEAVVDETSTKRADEIAGRDRAWVFEEAKDQFDQAARLRTDSARLIREQTQTVRQDADRVAALEKKLRKELQEVKSSLKALEEKSSTPDPETMESLFDELSRREESNRSEWEARLETTMNATIDAVRRTVMAALKGTRDTTVDATQLIVAKVLDDPDSALESNVTGIQDAETRVTDPHVGKGVRDNLARLKQLRKEPATEKSIKAAESSGTAEPSKTGEQKSRAKAKKSKKGKKIRKRRGTKEA